MRAGDAWPVALGAALAAATWRLAPPGLAGRLHVPPGDVLALLQRAWTALGHGLAVAERRTARPRRSGGGSGTATARLDAVDTALTGWVAGVGLFLVCAVAVYLAVL